MVMQNADGEVSRDARSGDD